MKLTKTNTFKIKKKRFKPVHIIVLGILGVIFCGSLLLWLPISHKTGLSYMDALFTATSATCLTGLGVVNLATSFTIFGQVVILCMIQISGLGLMTLATTIMMLLRKRFTLKDRMLMQEALGHDSNKGVIKLTKNVGIFVLISELIGAVVLMPFFVRAEGARGVYTAVFVSVSSFCNAGLEVIINSHSLTAYYSNPAVLLTVATLTILGGIGFAAVIDAAKYKLNFRKYHLHTKVVLSASAILLFGGTILLLLCEWSNSGTLGSMSFGDKLINAFFQSANCRTAGFTTLNQASLTPAGKLLSAILMFIGGSPGSAAGGIKTTTVAVVLLMLIAGLRRKDEIVLFKRTINKKTCVKAAAALVSGLIFMLMLTFTLLITEKNILSGGVFGADDLFYEAVSAFATVGLSSGITPLLSGAGKVSIMLAMLFGKIGAITLGAVFFSGPEAGGEIRYPEGNIHIG